MKFIKDKKVIMLIAIIFVFTISYFIVVNHVSFAFSNKYDVNKSYSTLIDTIKQCSIAYAKNNPNLFKNDNIIYIKVQDLIDSNLLVTNNNENIINPIDQTSSLNSNIIKIKIENDEIVVSVDS